MSRRKKSGNIFVSVGLPMLGFVIIGGGSLSVFMQHHFELKDRVHSSISERKFDLKKEHEKMIKDLDIENFALSRIPRPDEGDNANVNEEPLDLLKKLEDDAEFQALGKKIREDHARMLREKEKNSTQ